MASGPSLEFAHALLLGIYLGTRAVGELPAGGDAGTIPWGLIGLGVGLPLLLFGLWLLVGPVRDCDRLRRQWEALQRHYEAIREASGKAAGYLEERRAATEEEIAATESTGGRDEGRDSERMAAESVENWRGQLEEASAKADAARRAFEQCIGKAVTGASEGSPTTGGVPVVATAPPPSEQAAKPPGPSS